MKISHLYFLAVAHFGTAASEAEGIFGNLRGSIMRKMQNIMLNVPGYGGSNVFNPASDPTKFCANWEAKSSCTSKSHGGNYCEWSGDECAPLPYVAAQSDPVAYCKTFNGSSSKCKKQKFGSIDFCAYKSGNCYAGHAASRTNPTAFCEQFGETKESTCNSAGGGDICVWNGKGSCIVDGFVVDTRPSRNNDD